MAALTEIVQSVIDGINEVINLASPFASGDPIPDSSVYDSMLQNFPTIDRQAQEAYDLTVENEKERNRAQVLIEASDRVSAVYTMLFDIIPARDSREYDFTTISMTLPYLTFTLSALADIVDELNSDLVMMEAAPAPVKLSDNVMFVRGVAFVADSLLSYSKELKVAGFRNYAIQQLGKFSRGEEAEPFSLSFADGHSTLSCSFDGDNMEISNIPNNANQEETAWKLTISRNGDVYGNMDSGDLESVEGMRLTIDEPEEYCFVEK